jgi:hypothetical protein
MLSDASIVGVAGGFFRRTGTDLLAVRVRAPSEADDSIPRLSCFDRAGSAWRGIAGNDNKIADGGLSSLSREISRMCERKRLSNIADYCALAHGH